MSFLENRLPNKTPTKFLTKSVTSILNEVIYQRSNYIYFREKSIFVRNLLNSFNSNNPPPLQMVKTDHFDFQDIEKLAAQSDSVKIDEWRSIEGPIHHQNTPVSWLFQSCRYRSCIIKLRLLKMIVYNVNHNKIISQWWSLFTSH